MSWFVLALSPTGRVAHEVTAYLASSDLPELPSRPTRHVRWSDTGGTTHFAGWEAGRDPHHLVDGAGLVAFAGCPRPRRSAWPADRPIAERLREGLRSLRWAPDEHLCDAYALVGIEDTGGGVIANDPLGLHPLYEATVGETTILGNRADLVAGVAARQSGRPARRNARSGAWLALASYQFDDGTGFEGVRVTPQHKIARTCAGSVTLEERPPLFACGPDEALTAPEEVAEDLAADVAGALRHALAWSAEPPHLELTGGKDSRLVLAVALHAGLADRFTLATYGHAELPDMQVARSLAERLGLAHTDVTADHLAGALALPTMERYLRHVHRTSGTSELGQANEPTPKEFLTVSGLMGEVYRTANAQHAVDPPPCPTQAVARFHIDRRLGSLGLVCPRVASSLCDEAVDAFLKPLPEVRGPEDLRIVSFLRSRLPRWQAPLTELNEHRVLPLYSPDAMRGAFRMGHHARSHDRIHRYLVERAGDDLMDHPLVNSAWLGVDAPRSEVVRGLPTMKQQPATPDARDERRRVMHDLLDADRSNPLFELVDATAVRSGVDEMDASRPREQAQVMGAMAAIIWLSGRERRRVGDD